MRTDLISAWMIYEWVEQHVPDVAAKWSFEVDDQVKAAVQQIKAVLQAANLQAVSQHILAKMVIDQWDLTDITLFAGGIPTPLSPQPDQVIYYTDTNEYAVADAEKAGYRARNVNITQPDDLAQLNGSTTAIATGLFHFLPDTALEMAFANLAEAGFQQVIMTHATSEGGTDVIDQYSKLGVKVYTRFPKQLQDMIADHWQVEQVDPLKEVIQTEPNFGSQLTELPRLLDVYQIKRIN